MKNEGMTSTLIEDRTRQIPSGAFLGLAFGAMAASAVLALTGNQKWGNFIGLWVPSILILGTYNKIVKTFSAPYDEEQRLRHGDNASPHKEQDRGGKPLVLRV